MVATVMLRAKAAFLEMFEARFPGLCRKTGPFQQSFSPRLGDLAYTEIPMFGRI
jgi:hypothetical protein